MKETSWPQPALCDLEATARAQKQIGLRHTDVVVPDFAVAERHVVFTEYWQHALDPDPRRIQRDKASAARDALMTVPKSERAAALMASGGALNILLDGGLSRAKLDSEHAVSATRQIGAFTLDQLSDLALRMGFDEIANCHTREALQLRQLTQGRESKPVGCRPKVYPALGKEDIDRLAATGDMATLDGLTKDWAKQTWLSGFMTVTYNQHTKDEKGSD